MDRCTKLLLNSYSNPWEELEFNNTSAKDKGFTPEEDRYLLCWVRKYGHGQWEAIRLAIRRCDKFRFSFYIRAMSAESIGKRCEQLMRACEREVEAIQKKVSSDEAFASVSAISRPNSFRTFASLVAVLGNDERGGQGQHYTSRHCHPFPRGTNGG